MSETTLIDRVAAMQIFSDMLTGTSSKRILRITGAEKMGKSRLLREYRKMSLEKSNCYAALIDLRSKFQSYGDVIFQITQQMPNIGYQSFLNVQQQASTSPKVEIKGSRLLLSSMFLHFPDSKKDSDEYDRQKVIAAFCQDLRAAKIIYPVLLLFDTVDGANANIQNWLNEQFISAVLQIPNTFVVLAGRSLPDMPSIWYDACHSYTLPPVTLEDHMAYCKSLGITASEEIVQAFHKAFEGTPGLFAEYAPKLGKEE